MNPAGQLQTLVLLINRHSAFNPQAPSTPQGLLHCPRIHFSFSLHWASVLHEAVTETLKIKLAGDFHDLNFYDGHKNEAIFSFHED